MTFQENFKLRTKAVGLETIKLVDELPNKPVAWIISKQIIRSSTSVGANYRAACRARSDADFIHKLKTVEEETDESIYWLELLRESSLITADKASKLIGEFTEVLAIVVTSIKSSKQRLGR